MKTRCDWIRSALEITDRIYAYGLFFNAATLLPAAPDTHPSITLMAIDIVIVMLYYVIVPN